MSKPELTAYLPLANPNDRATHVQVKVYHYKGHVVLSVNLAEVKANGIVSVLMMVSGGGKTYHRLAAMPRLAPKKLQGFIDDVKANLAARTGIAWEMVTSVAASVKATMPEPEPAVT